VQRKTRVGTQKPVKKGRKRLPLLWFKYVPWNTCIQNIILQVIPYNPLHHVLMQQAGPHQMPHHAFGLPSFQNHEFNECLFFYKSPYIQL
jgi:hypothetical protein